MATQRGYGSLNVQSLYETRALIAYLQLLATSRRNGSAGCAAKITALALEQSFGVLLAPVGPSRATTRVKSMLARESDRLPDLSRNESAR